jgi:isochorismate synthase
MTQSLSCAIPINERPSILERLAEHLRALLGRTRSNHDLLVATVEVPCIDALSLWSAVPSWEAWFWAPPLSSLTAESSQLNALCTCAVGAAGEVVGEGEDRFSQVRSRAKELWARILRQNVPETPVFAHPRLVGGFSFRPGSAREAAWFRFGDARFVLPRWTYTQTEARAWLSLVVSPQVARDLAHSPVARDIEAIERLFGPRPCPRNAVRWQTVGEDLSPLEPWTRLVERAQADICEGRIHKVVGARNCVIHTDNPIDPSSLLQQLRRDNPASTTFGIRVGRATFAGATPETLIHRRGLRIHTEALAGTSNRETSEPNSLLDSTKDRCEQRFVEEEIVSQLRPLCVSLEVPQQPVAHALRKLVHLRTPIDGELKRDVHVVDLVEKLHPTPAVGGLPREEAHRWLRAHESMQRGWYASPVGWFDEAGDGTFVVALRCGLIDGERAVLYAGAGLVSGSNPAAEYAETGWKLQVLGDALRAAGTYGSS